MKKFIHTIYKSPVRIVLIASLLFLLFSAFFLIPSHAQSTTTVSEKQYGTSDCGVAIWFTESLYGDMLGTTSSSVCGLTAGKFIDKCSVASNAQLCATLTKNGVSPNSYRTSGAVGLLLQTTGYLTDGVTRNGPDSVTFVASKFSPTVSAQTSALQGLSPILVLWGTFRNLSYILIAIALVVTGLSLYFNTKSGGGKQDNVAITTAIVDIVGTLITITLSYVVAGVTVDLIINLGNAAIASFFQPFINSTDVLNNLYNTNGTTNLFTMLSDFQGAGSSASIINLIKAGFDNLNTPISQTSAFFTNLSGSNALVGALTSVIFTIAAGIIRGAINSPLITAIISFTIFILIFRIVFLLLGAFVAIVMQIAFAPLILIPGAFPGTSSGKAFVEWLKKIIAAAITFPIVFATLLLSAIFLNISQSGTTTDPSKNPCVYDSTIQNPVNITGSYVSEGFDSNGVSTGQQISKPKVFNTTRFVNNNSDPTQKCYPILLPPKFGWLPAPLGNLGSGFSIDDFTRFVVGIAFLIILPNITKAVQGGLNIKSQQLGGVQDALAGASFFNTFVQQVPIVGKPLGQIIGSITSAIK